MSTGRPTDCRHPPDSFIWQCHASSGAAVCALHVYSSYTQHVATIVPQHKYIGTQPDTECLIHELIELQHALCNDCDHTCRLETKTAMTYSFVTIACNGNVTRCRGTMLLAIGLRQARTKP